MGTLMSTPKPILPGTENTMLSTKTVKHRAPIPSVILPAPQAAAEAALRRQVTSQNPAVNTSLTESTLKNVPQVVNVRELKSSGSPPTVSAAVGSSVPQSAAQGVHQGLAPVATNQVNQATPSSTLKMQMPPSSAVVTVPSIPQTSAGKKNSGATKTVTSATPPVTSISDAASQFNKDFPFAPSGAGFNFAAVPASAATPASSVLEATVTPAKEPNQLPEAFALGGGMKFASVPETPFTFGGSKPPSLSAFGRASSGDPAGLSSNGQAGETSLPFANAPKQSDLAIQASAAGETLGSFSGLRVGQADENAKAAPVKGPSTGTAAAPQPAGFSALSASKPADAIPAALTTTAGSATGGIFGNVQLVSPGPPGIFSLAAPAGGAKTPFAFGGPPVSAPQVSSSSSSALPPSAPNLSFGGLLSAASTPAALASKGEEDARTTPPEKTPLTERATSPTAQVDPQGSVLAAEQCPAEVPPLAAPPAEAEGGGQLTTPSEAAPSKDPTPASAPGEPKTEGLPPEGPAEEQTPASSTPPAIGSQLTEPTATSPPTTAASVAPAPVTNTSAFTEAVPTSSGFAQPSGLPASSSPPSSSSSTGSAFSQPTTAGLTNPSAAPVFGQVSAAALPVSTPFGQPPATSPSSSASATGFNTSVFGTAATSGFGQSAFGQAPVFGQSTANPPGGFTFNQAGFGATPAFGQAASSAPPASSSGNVFGAASSTSTASSFSFGQPSTAAGLFAQSSAPVFGQNSSFGQSGTIFASPASMTTTTPTSSAGFSFCQASAFGSSSPSTVFGQAANASGSVFGQSSSSGGGVFGSGGAGGRTGGFFSGLGGKPSHEAANKNPFGCPTSGFGSSTNQNTSTLFGNSGAKSFGFGTASFGEQKPMGTFSSGGGSVASQGFGFSSPTKTGGFGAAPVFGSPPTFGGSPGFGGVPAFGSAPAFASPLGSAGGKVFGEGTAAANAGGFGFGNTASTVSFGTLASQNTPTFGSLSQQPTGFGTQSSGFSGFGSSGGGFGFGSSNASNTGFSGWRS